MTTFQRVTFFVCACALPCTDLARCAAADESTQAVAPPNPRDFGTPGGVGSARGWYVWQGFNPETWEAQISRDPPQETWAAKVLPWATTYRRQSYGARPNELLPGERVNVFFAPSEKTRWGYVCHFQDEISQMKGHGHSWQVREVEPTGRWFRASLYMANEKKLNDVQQTFVVDLECEKWQAGKRVEQFSLTPGDHVYMTWVWHNRDRTAMLLADEPSLETLKERQSRATHWRILDEGLAGTIDEVSADQVKTILFSTYWQQSRELAAGDEVRLVLAGIDQRPSGESVAAKLLSLKFGGTYGSGPTDLVLQLQNPDDSARLKLAKDSMVRIIKSPSADVRILRRVLQAASAWRPDGTQPYKSRRFDSATRSQIESLVATLGDQSLRERAEGMLPELEKAAVEFARQRELAKQAAAVHGTLGTAPAGPDWLRDLVGNESMQVFDRTSVVDLFDRTLKPKSGVRTEQVSDEWLSRIADLPDIETLELQSTAVTNASVKTIAGLKTLRRLSLTLQPVTAEGIAQLGGLTQLRVLTLASTKCTGEGCGQLTPLTRLENLNFHYTPVNDAGLAQIGKLKTLERLEIVHTHFTDEGAKHLANLTNLRRLHLGSREATGAAVANVRGIGLGELDLHDGQANDEGARHAGAIRSLRTLRVFGPVTDEGIASLVDLKNLEQLVLESGQVSDVGLKALGSLPRLRWLELRGTKVTEGGVRELSTAIPGIEIRH